MKWESSPKFVHNLELIAFEYNMHKHGILTPSKQLEQMIPSEIDYYDSRKVIF